MKITVDFNIPEEFIQSLITKEWLDAKFKEYLDNNGTDPGTDPDPDPEPINKCKAGPEIRKITLITDQKLQVNFWALDVTEIEYTLYKSNKEVEKGIFKPINDVPFIELKNKLTAGNYKLKFKATLCQGEDIKEFTYTPPTTPPPVIGKQTLDITFYYDNK